MSVAEFVGRLTGELEGAGVPYMLAGSFASSFHGALRATQDVDLVIDADVDAIRRLVNQLPHDRFYVDEQTAVDAVRRLTQFNIIDGVTGWKADLIQRKARPFSQAEFDRRQRVDYLGLRLWMASAEDVVVSKLEWAKKAGSELQLRDVAGVLVAKRGKLDLAYIEKWVAELGVSDEWHRVLSG